MNGFVICRDVWRHRSRRIYTRTMRTWSYCVRSLNEPVVFQRRVDKTSSHHNLFHLLVASVAQLVEQLTLNQLVPGSSPGRGTIHGPVPDNTECSMRMEQNSCFTRVGNSITDESDRKLVRELAWLKEMSSGALPAVDDDAQSGASQKR